MGTPYLRSVKGLTTRPNKPAKKSGSEAAVNNSTDARLLKRSHFHSDVEFVTAVEEQYGHNDCDPYSPRQPSHAYLNVPRRIRLQYTKAKVRVTIRIVNELKKQLGVS